MVSVSIILWVGRRRKTRQCLKTIQQNFYPSLVSFINAAEKADLMKKKCKSVNIFR